MTLRLVIDEKLRGTRLDKALAQISQIGSRSRAESLLRGGYVQMVQRRSGPLKNASQIKPSLKVEEGDAFEVNYPDEGESDSLSLVPLKMPLEILYEDEDLLVVNKPARLVVHPAVGHEQDTLVNALLSHTSQLSMGFSERRPGIVHRLDRDTSGLLVVAKNDFAHRHLSLQFQERKVHRIYWAIVFGVPRKPADRIESYLIRHPVDRKKFCSDSRGRGKFAVTHYRVIKSSQAQAALLECKLETGRTHQIRVHLSELGHPLFGDAIYGSTRRLKSIKSSDLRNLASDMNRIALHATELGFHHPRSDKQLFFNKGWPDDLLALVERLDFMR